MWNQQRRLKRRIRKEWSSGRVERKMFKDQRREKWCQMSFRGFTLLCYVRGDPFKGKVSMESLGKTLLRWAPGRIGEKKWRQNADDSHEEFCFNQSQEMDKKLQEKKIN